MEIKDILAYFGPFAGLIIGWVLYEMSFRSRVRYDDRKKLKEVLYNLLEVFHVTYKLNNIEPYLNLVITKLMDEVYQEDQKEEMAQFLKKNYKKLIEVKLTPLLLDNFGQVKERYDKAISSLASIEPLLAYKLSGKPRLVELPSIFKDWVENEFINYNIENREELIGKLHAHFDPLMINDLLKSFENDIKTVAWKIGVRVWYKSKQTINSIRNMDSVSREDTDRVSKMIGMANN